MNNMNIINIMNNINNMNNVNNVVLCSQNAFMFLCQKKDYI